MHRSLFATFGDLLRVPGSVSSLEKEKAAGADIRIVLSGLDALEIARINPDNQVIFLGIGFETTAPGTAVTIKLAEMDCTENFFVLSAHKVMPPAMEALLKEEQTSMDLFVPDMLPQLPDLQYLILFRRNLISAVSSLALNLLIFCRAF